MIPGRYLEEQNGLPYRHSRKGSASELCFKAFEAREIENRHSVFQARGFVQGEDKISWGDNRSNRKVSKFAIVCPCRIPKIRLPSFLNFKKTSKMQICKNALFSKRRRLWISFDPTRSLFPPKTLQIVRSSLVVFLYWLVLPSFPTSWPDAPSSRSLTLSASVHSPSRH